MKTLEYQLDSWIDDLGLHSLNLNRLKSSHAPESERLLVKDWASVRRQRNVVYVWRLSIDFRSKQKELAL